MNTMISNDIKLFEWTLVMIDVQYGLSTITGLEYIGTGLLLKLNFNIF